MDGHHYEVEKPLSSRNDIKWSVTSIESIITKLFEHSLVVNKQKAKSYNNKGTITTRNLIKFDRRVTFVSQISISLESIPATYIRSEVAISKVGRVH